MKKSTFFVWLLIVLIYYTLGGQSFPDYANYITLSQNGGYLFYENEYFAEWLSRLWLANVGRLIGDHQLSVDIFSAIIQITYLIWAVNGHEKNKLIAKFWITIFLGPLLLTTTIRATVSYLCVFQVFLGELTLKRILFYGLVGASFHDAVLIPVAMILGMKIFENYLKIKMPSFLLIVSFCIIALGPYLVNFALELINSFGIGIREIYFQNYLSPSVAKYVYALFILTLSFFVLHVESEPLAQSAYMSIVVVSTMMFSIASTPAIRLYLYAFGPACILLVRGTGLMGKLMRNKIVLLTVPIFILPLMIFDLFRNVEV